MVTFSKPIAGNQPQGNDPQELKPIILLERPKPQELVNSKYHSHKLCTTPCNTNSPTYDLVVLFFDTGTIEEWLKFAHNLSAIITGQNIIDVQGAYAITKKILY
eukprot:3577232-Ditylum_brightwellii.AAC.1